MSVATFKRSPIGKFNSTSRRLPRCLVLQSLPPPLQPPPPRCVDVTSLQPSRCRLQVVRARFAATELGIREKLAVVMLAQSSLSVALNETIGGHVPRLLIYADASRIDADMNALTNLVPYRAVGSGGSGGGSQRAHTHILNSIFDQVCYDRVLS